MAKKQLTPLAKRIIWSACSSENKIVTNGEIAEFFKISERAVYGIISGDISLKSKRRPKIPKKKIKQIKRTLAKGDFSIAEIAKLFSVSITTVQNINTRNKHVKNK